MATIKFNAKQLKNPTPAGIANAVQIFTVIASALIAWIGTANFIPIHLSTILQSLLGLSLTIANGLKPFFGVETTQKEVAIEDVSVIDEKAVEPKKPS